ncbi:MAG: hypoxanthine phosphoribosyltransferase [Actinomycetota bacterium]
MSEEISDILISQSELKARVAELAAEISRDYKGKDLVLIGILKGAFIFLADLCRQLTIPASFDFIAVSSYGSGTRSGGIVRILKDLDTDITGKDVVIVEDIIDSGLTLNYLHKSLRARNPSSLEICALLRKPEMDRVKLDAKYIGFSIPSDFVVGYGLDYAGKYRNLPHIVRLRPKPKSVQTGKTNGNNKAASAAGR